MIVCPHCTHNNLEGTLFCEKCGKSLFVEKGSQEVSTRQLQEDGDIDVRPTWGTAHFAQEADIILHIHDAPKPVVLSPMHEAVLGRADEVSGTSPDLDLTPYNALEKGVSRIHAAIRRGEDTLTLVDLGSVNGTHLNGQRLVPNQPRVLRDGDEIRLGRLVVHIYFRYNN
jgi:pSer/pThr/pTyr-binding forkhead associated (FHA) protein